ncbi:hypothetical protein DYB25_004356 [Aphanomyces astaci]|uniref:Transcriptional coactivator p15 (PC4) C-terminal domain-containing protein n=1 Tax=Aphanomyces astaci TaxID=112090 RepID=A0A397F5F1_APHAT|nr:hypothetical protein DYB25_004356 [Aphanomyces astaci]RHY61263.1 hypothetical protein DYB30_004792 [Aphanomyces astaci]RHZ15898.1 hypothetical protein DYB31_002776 [Aphanomyces astaci]RHZ19057.1 hypothetical protein DYB26_002535 [Aphanomyces astaci]
MSSSAGLVKPKPRAAATPRVVKDEEEHVSPTDETKKRERNDSEDEGAAVKKSKADDEDEVGAGEKQSDGSIVFDLSAKKQVSVRAWKSAILVDIREYYDSNGERKPGKKGISLTSDQWKAMTKLISDIDVAVKWVQDPDTPAGTYEADTLSDVEANSVAFAISSKRRASVRKFKSMVLVDFREYYDASGTLKPGQKGISLTNEQWTKLKERADAINAAMKSFK